MWYHEPWFKSNLAVERKVLRRDGHGTTPSARRTTGGDRPRLLLTLSPHSHSAYILSAPVSVTFENTGDPLPNFLSLCPSVSALASLQSLLVYLSRAVSVYLPLPCPLPTFLPPFASFLLSSLLPSLCPFFFSLTFPLPSSSLTSHNNK